MPKTFQTRLSVNVNKIATLRNARGKGQPDLLDFTRLIIRSGAKGVTAHPRPDERHIRFQDIHNLKALLSEYKDVEFNVEGYPGLKFLRLMKAVRPHQCTLVPDGPDVLTSNAGWRPAANQSLLQKSINTLQKSGIRVSLFLDPRTVSKKDLKALKALAPERAELYTERYSRNFHSRFKKFVTASYADFAETLHALSIGVNAGHDLNQKNLSFLLCHVPYIQEVSIGHALITEALKSGLKKTIARYLQIIKKSSEMQKKRRGADLT